MVSKSIITTLADYTITNELNTESTTHIKDSNRINPLSSYAITPKHNSSHELVELLNDDHEHIDNNTTQSKFTNKKKFKVASMKSIVTLKDNALITTTNETTTVQRSCVWQYAVRCPDSNYATCSLCSDKKKISTNNGSTSTLRKHLISKHHLNELSLSTVKRKNVTQSISVNEKRRLHDLFINCIIRDGRTFNDLQKPGMKKILEAIIPGYEPPTRFAVARRLKSLHVFHHKKLIADLASIDHISITLDFWSNRQMRSFLVITGHYFGVNSFNLQSTVLNFSTFDNQHKSVNISQVLQVKLKELNILHKVVGVTCDGGQNLVRAICNLDLNLNRLWCVAHRLHLCITKAFGFWIVKEKQSEEDATFEEQDTLNNGLSDRHGEITSIEKSQNSNEIDELYEIDMDTANDFEPDDNDLLKKDQLTDEEELLSDTVDGEIVDNWVIDVDESDVDIVYDQEMIMFLLKKCRGFIAMVKQSTIITLFFDAERKKSNIKRNLCYDIKSRWNSTYSMLDSLLSLRELIEKLFSYKHHLQIRPKQMKKLYDFELTSDEWIVLSTLHSILKPFLHATKAMSGRQYPSIGLALYLLTRLKMFLQQHETKESSLAKRLKKLLLAQFIHYFESDNEQVQLLKLHSYFDPVGFATLIDTEKRSIEQTIKSMVIDEPSDSIVSIKDALPASATNINTSNISHSHKTSNKTAMDMFNESVGEIHYEENRHDGNKKAIFTEEIHTYQKLATQFNLNHKADATSSVLFWQNYGHTFSILGKVAKQMLSTPATSVPSESCFSISSFLGRKERARLTGENLSSSIFLKDKLNY